MRPQGIDHLGPLPHQKVTRSMQHQTTPCCSADLICTKRMVGRRTASTNRCSGVSGMVVLALDVGLHVLLPGISRT